MGEAVEPRRDHVTRGGQQFNASAPRPPVATTTPAPPPAGEAVEPRTEADAESIKRVARVIHDGWKSWVFDADAVTMPDLDHSVPDWQDMMLEIATRVIESLAAADAAVGSTPPTTAIEVATAAVWATVQFQTGELFTPAHARQIAEAVLAAGSTPTEELAAALRELLDRCPDCGGSGVVHVERLGYFVADEGHECAECVQCDRCGPAREVLARVGVVTEESPKATGGD